MADNANDTLSESGATFQFGTVSAIDAKACKVRVRLPNCENLRTQWLPVMQFKTLKDKHYHLPDIGEHVVVLLDARGEDGVVLGAIYSEADTPPVGDVNKHHVKYEDGTTIDYDRAAKKLAINCVGDIDIIAAGVVTIKGKQILLN